MATNPMQRQKKVSFLTGVVITLLVTGTIIALLVMQLSEIKKKEKEAEGRTKTVQILNMDVKSGQLITSDMFQPKKVDSLLVPSDAITTSEDLELYNLQTTDGYTVICQKEENSRDVKYYIKDENGDQDNTIEIEYRDEKYYRKDNNSEVEFNRVPMVAKIDMLKNTVLTGSVLNQSDELVTEDVREQEYNMLNIQSDIKDEDVIDVRLRMPSGQDYIVVSKKTVKIPSQDGVTDGETIKIKLSEDEILTMSNAIVESYIMKGSELYVAKYVEPGLQGAAIPTYPLNAEVITLLENDPNLTQKAMEAIRARYQRNDNAMSKERNDKINSIIGKIDEDTRNSNIESSIQTNVTKSKELRKKFLEQAANAAEAAATETTTDTTSTAE